MTDKGAEFDEENVQQAVADQIEAVEKTHDQSTAQANTEQPSQLRVVQIFPQAKGLKNLDSGRDKSDTQCVLKMKWHKDQTEWHEVDHTEVIHDDLDPNWSHYFSVIYNFGQDLKLRFEVNDMDADGSAELVGTYDTTLAELVKEKDLCEKPLTGPHQDAGFLILKAEEKRNAQNKVTLGLEVAGLPECQNIMKCNFSTTYFMEVLKGPRGNNGKIYESNFFVDQMTHEFEILEFTDQELCNTDADAPIEIKFVNRNQYQMENKEICFCVTSLAKLKEHSGGQKIPLINETGKTVANLVVKRCDLEKIPAFSDYLKSGYEISLMGAVDFTYSNGSASNPTSLHYTGQEDGPGNQYEQALRAVGSILSGYDADQKYPFYGFGGIPDGADKVSHCFPISGDQANPELEGIDNVIAAYRDSVTKVKFLGPTYFAPLLKQAKENVRACTNDKMYWILLILTDGEIHDMKETIEEIAEISEQNLPMSIIIIGVGDEDFANMVRLDGDDVAIKAGCKDIVQFVKFQEVIRRSEQSQAMENLAATVLEEVPQQLVATFTAKGMLPQ